LKDAQPKSFLIHKAYRFHSLRLSDTVNIALFIPHQGEEKLIQQARTAGDVLVDVVPKSVREIFAGDIVEHLSGKFLGAENVASFLKNCFDMPAARKE
jgi:hypothetical protein